MADGRLQTLDDLRALPHEVLVAKFLESQARVKSLECLNKNLKAAVVDPEQKIVEQAKLKAQDINENVIETPLNPGPDSLYHPPSSPHPNPSFSEEGLDACDSLPLVQSPYVTTPPYEYIVLTKENERKLRIFYNAKVENVFQHQMKRLKDQGQGQGQEGVSSSPNSSSREKCHHQSLKNKASIAGTPTPSFILDGEDDALVVHCFDDSNVDLEIKKLLKERPPTTHKFVRRKSRVERGSSVPAIDSYYGTEDLEKVGHASYFIPELTPTDRKAIGWKDTYSYGKWKYSSGENREKEGNGTSMKSIYNALRKSKSGNKGKSHASKKSSVDIILASDGLRDSHSVSRLARSIFGSKSQGHPETVAASHQVGIKDQDSNHATIGSCSTAEVRAREGQKSSASEDSSFIELAGVAVPTHGWKFKKGKKRLKNWMTHLVPCYKVKKEKRKGRYLTFTANLESECDLVKSQSLIVTAKKKKRSAFKYFSKRKPKSGERLSRDTSVIGGDLVADSASASLLAAAVTAAESSIEEVKKEAIMPQPNVPDSGKINSKDPHEKSMMDEQSSCSSLKLDAAAAKKVKVELEKRNRTMKRKLGIDNEPVENDTNDHPQNQTKEDFNSNPFAPGKGEGECPSTSTNSVQATNSVLLNDLVGDCLLDDENENFEDEDEYADLNDNDGSHVEYLPCRPRKSVEDFDFPETRFLDLKDLNHPRYGSGSRVQYYEAEDYGYGGDYDDEDWQYEEYEGDGYGEDEEDWADYYEDDKYPVTGSGQGSGLTPYYGSANGKGSGTKKIPPLLGQNCKVAKKAASDCQVS